ncbi:MULTISPECIES: glucose-6-phosphate dehydrogenase assembly protein OpcA [Micrococcaceae]|uniref:glucose-6-phosphate dehydrogenase assembly protein OpcA n=1 Tax=unclassified Kocuria TaxID=2649579 RepID=UPI001011846D|nr:MULTISPECIES: glucose-6-phosphate dehydrogenase assembly protein OpcA [unclassified Kocuria]
MIRTLKDTTSSEVDKALALMREETGIRTLGRVLTLVIMADMGHSEKAIDAAITASHEHPCRIIVHITHDPNAKNRLDAEVSMGGDAGASEIVVLRGWGESAHPSESLIAALLLPDAPIVAWWPHSLPECPAEHSIGKIAHRRITDSARAEVPWDSLNNLRKRYAPGDTDLAWTRLTLWRIQLAAVMDDPKKHTVNKVIVEGSEKSPSVLLLGTWLGYRLDAQVEIRESPQPRGLYRVTLCREDGEVTIYRPGRNIATLSIPKSADQQLALPVRSLAECLAEELRRLDPDEVFGEVLNEALSRSEVTLTQGAAPVPAGDPSRYTEVYDA